MNSENSDARQARVFDAVLSSITDFAYTFDRAGRLTYVNKALLDLWGLDSDREVLGKTLFELNYPEDLATKIHRQIDEVFRSIVVVRGSTPMPPRDLIPLHVPAGAAPGGPAAVPPSTAV